MSSPESPEKTSPQNSLSTTAQLPNLSSSFVLANLRELLHALSLARSPEEEKQRYNNFGIKNYSAIDSIGTDNNEL